MNLLTAIKGGSPGFPKDKFRQGGTKTLFLHRQNKQDLVQYPFRFNRASATGVSMIPGTLNEMYVPVLGEENSDPANPVVVQIENGTTYFYLECTIESDSTQPEFGTFAATGGMNIVAEGARRTTPAEWNRPFLCLARVDATPLDGGVPGYNITCYNEVFSALQLVQFFDRYVFFPYFVPADLVAAQGG